MKGELMPGFTCPPEESATTSTTKSTPKTCNAELERNDSAQRNPEASLDDRRVHSRLQDSKLSSDSIRKKDASRRIRPSSGGKDRHSKVNTAKGPRDRRVRLSVSTAIQFYDVQDRLGYDQPSKAVEWLLREAKAAIDKLPELHEQLALQVYRSSTTVSGSDTRHFYAQGASIGGLKSLVGISDAGRSEDESGLAMQEIIGVGKACSSVEAPLHHAKVTATSDQFSKAIDSQPGATSARIQLRTKARDRARERAKERSYGVYKEPAKASCSTTSIPSSTMHGEYVPHYSKFLASHDRESIVLSPPDHHLENIVPSPSHEHVQKFHLQSLGDDKAPSSFRHAFRNYVHTEQMVEAALSIQAATGRDPLSPSPAFVHDTEVHDFHHKYQKLPNLLNQASQSWPQTITMESCSPESLYCSSRKPPFSPPSYLDSGMAFRHDDSARLVSCSNAISHELAAVFGVPISSFTGTIMPADRIPMTPSILSLDPSQSAFRETSQLPASHQEQALSDHFHVRRISSAHPFSFGSRPNYHVLLNSPAAGVSQLASSSAFEPFSNQFPGTTYSRTSSDFQHYDNALFNSRDSETLQSDLKLPARLRGLDDIEEQLKRYSHS